MVYATPYKEPYYLGAEVSVDADVGLYPVALGGRPFTIDKKIDAFRHRSVPLLRQQADQSESPGDTSINPEGLWRKSAESWHAGAGQTHFDRRESNPFRFRASKGVNVWDKWQLTLLPDTTEKVSSLATNLHMVVVGTHLYWAEDAALRFTTSLVGVPAITDLTGDTGGPVQSMATDGFHVWTTHGANGIFRTTRGAATTASHITGTVELVAYAKGRVLAANDNSIYDVTTLAMGAGGALPVALFSHPNTDFQWTNVTEAATFIYLAGFSGDKSQIYRTELDDDGTGLLPPVVAAPLPDGEVVTAIQGYLNFVVVGTTRGIRFATPSDSGDLTLGALIETPNSVTCFEPQDRFVWFGYTNYDSTSTGLGRLDLSVFGDPDALTPAYASDLMVTGQGNIDNIVTFQDKRVFTVAGDGIYTESPNLVPSGYVDSGDIGLGLADPKIGLFVDVHTIGSGTYQAHMSVDSATFGPLGGAYDAGTERTLEVGEARGKNFEVRITLNRDAVVLTAGPTLTDWLFRAQPAPEIARLIEVPLVLAPTIIDLTGGTQPMDTVSDLEWIANLNASKQVVRYQEGERSFSVVLNDFEVVVKDVFVGANGQSGIGATAIVQLKVVN